MPLELLGWYSVPTLSCSWFIFHSLPVDLFVLLHHFVFLRNCSNSPAQFVQDETRYTKETRSFKLCLYASVDQFQKELKVFKNHDFPILLNLPISPFVLTKCGINLRICCSFVHSSLVFEVIASLSNRLSAVTVVGNKFLFRAYVVSPGPTS